LGGKEAGEKSLLEEGRKKVPLEVSERRSLERGKKHPPSYDRKGRVQGRDFGKERKKGGGWGGGGDVEWHASEKSEKKGTEAFGQDK